MMHRDGVTALIVGTRTDQTAFRQDLSDRYTVRYPKG